jgi:hypothetical protein
MTDIPDITAETLVARSPSVVTAEVDGRLVMMSIDQGRYFGLNDVAGDVWDRIASPRPFGDLVDDLAGAYDAGREAVADDVATLLREMHAREVIVLDPRGRSRR